MRLRNGSHITIPLTLALSHPGEEPESCIKTYELVPKNPLWSFRDNTIGVESCDAVVGSFDVVEIHSVFHSRHLVEALQIRRKIRIVDHTTEIAFEQPVIGNVEANERHECAPVGLRHALA